MTMKSGPKIYKIVSYLTAALIALYIGVGQLIERGKCSESGLTSFFLGTPYLTVSGDVLDLRPQRDATSLELMFEPPLAGDEREHQREGYSAELGKQGRWLTLLAHDARSLKNTAITWQIRGRDYPGYIGEHRIIEAKLDGSDIRLGILYRDFVTDDSTTIRIGYPPIDAPPSRAVIAMSNPII